MARIKGIKIPKKTERLDPLFTDEKYVGFEPTWVPEDAKLPQAEFDHKLRGMLKYYNYFFSIKDMRKYVVTWMKTQPAFTHDDVLRYNKSSDDYTTMQAACIARAAGKGMPMNERTTTYLVSVLRKAIETVATAKPVVAVTPIPTVKAPSIQDRMAEKTSDVIGEIEGEVDEFLKKYTTKFKLFTFLTARNVPQSQVGKVRAVVQKQHDMFTEAFASKDKQLVEGYSNIDKKNHPKVIAFYTAMLADLDAYVHVKKTTKKARVVKVPSKEKQVARVKYMKEHKELKMVSLNPVSIIGSTDVWVFDTKYRKIYRYIADSLSGTLGIKGSCIVGFDEAKSVGKTVRKPEEFLPLFMKTGKIALRTFMSTIKAVEVKANGRLTEHQLILKIS